MLVSVKNFDTSYVGETKNLKRRFYKHNSGYGSSTTNDIESRPWAIAGYICGLGHLDKVGRQQIEAKWRQYNHTIVNQGRTDLMARLEQGRRVVQEENSSMPEEENKISFVQMIRRKVASGGVDEGGQ